MKPESNQTNTAKLKRLSQFMDSSIRLPGGIRIGWDGIIGLVPGVGDLAGLAISSYIIFSAAKLGASKLALIRMIINVGLESAIGTIPIVGDLFDLGFKANNRNMKLLDNHNINPGKVATRSRRWLYVWLISLVSLFFFCIWLALRMLIGLAGWLF